MCQIWLSTDNQINMRWIQYTRVHMLYFMPLHAKCGDKMSYREKEKQKQLLSPDWILNEFLSGLKAAGVRRI